jgi:hypothetical protein
MKVWFSKLPLEAKALLVTGAAVSSLLLLTFLFFSVTTMFDSWRTISASKPKVARLMGYQNQSDRLETAVARLSDELAALAYESEKGDIKAGASLQQALRGYAEEAGFVVTGSQLRSEELVAEAVEADSEEAPVDQVSKLVVDLSLLGPPMALDTFLTEIRAHRPFLAPTSMEISRPRQRRSNEAQAAQPGLLSVRLEVAALEIAK